MVYNGKTHKVLKRDFNLFSTLLSRFPLLTYFLKVKVREMNSFSDKSPDFLYRCVVKLYHNRYLKGNMYRT